MRLLEAVVEEGTGTAAAVEGYRVAGKTGTAQKAEPGKGYYEDRHVASFAGFAPSRRPAFVAAVVIDEPRGLYHGGEVAAPVFGAIARQLLPYLGVMPDEGAPAETGAAVRLASAGPGTSASAVAPRAGEVPDLSGLTAREAVALSSRFGLETRLHGSGWVARQEHAAGSRLAPTEGRLELWLTSGAGG